MVAQDVVDDLVMLGGVARPMHMDAVRPRIGLELLEIFVEMRERVFLDGGGKRAKLLPFGNAMHFAVALLAQIPEPLVMHFLVFGGGNEARGRFRLVDGAIAVDLSHRAAAARVAAAAAASVPSA